MISAQNVEALWNAVAHVQPARRRPQLLARPRPDAPLPRGAFATTPTTYVSCYPNAGLPNPLSPTGFHYSPEDMEDYLGEFAACRPRQPRRRLLRQHPGAHRRHRPRRRPPRPAPGARPRRNLDHRGSIETRNPPPSASPAPRPTTTPPDKSFLMIGERTNVAGSPQFAQAGPRGRSRGRPRRRPPAGRERRQRHRHLLRRRPDRRQGDDDPLPPPRSRASRTSPRCRSWSIPRSGRSSRPA